MIYNLTKLNSRWNTRKLRSLGEFARGKSKHRPRNDQVLYEGGGYPFIQTGDIKAADLYITSHEQEYNKVGLAQSKLWDAGTLAITIAANIAETGILSYPMCFPDSVVGFTAHPGETSELYMHYIFAYIRTSIQRSVGGSIQDNINIDYLENLEFKIPDKITQDRLVSILVMIDRKIAINNAINAELEKTAKLLYDYWFTQFDFPDADGKPYRSSGGAMEYNAQLKREIPKGWTHSVLSDIAYIIMGQSPDGISYNTEGDGMIFFQGCTDFGHRFPTSRVYTNKPSRIAEQGDILLSVRAPVGMTNIAYEKCCVGRGLSVLRSKISANTYLNQVIQGVSERLNTMSGNGTTFGAVTKDMLYELPVCKPVVSVIKAYEDKIAPMDRLIFKHEMQTRELTALRDFLLPLLMNGQVTLATAESVTE